MSSTQKRNKPMVLGEQQQQQKLKRKKRKMKIEMSETNNSLKVNKHLSSLTLPVEHFRSPYQACSNALRTLLTHIY